MGRLRPFEAHPPLAVDRDAVLAAPAAPQFFQPVARRGGPIASTRAASSAFSRCSTCRRTARRDERLPAGGGSGGGLRRVAALGLATAGLLRRLACRRSGANLSQPARRTGFAEGAMKSASPCGVRRTRTRSLGSFRRRASKSDRCTASMGAGAGPRRKAAAGKARLSTTTSNFQMEQAAARTSGGGVHFPRT